MAFDLFRRSPAPASAPAPADSKNDAYKELCKKVRRIDEKAADYMEELLAAHERGETLGVPFDPRATIYGSFVWSGTPQGHAYWRAIVERLGDASSYPTAARASTPVATEKFPVGTRVRLRVEHNNDKGKGPSVGATGTVRTVETNPWGDLRGIRFDDAFPGGHRLGGALAGRDSECGWWVPIDKLEAVATDGTPMGEAAHAEEDVRIPLSELEGYDAGEALVGVECFVWDVDRDEVPRTALGRGASVLERVDPARPFPYLTAGNCWIHAVPAASVEAYLAGRKLSPEDRDARRKAAAEAKAAEEARKAQEKAEAAARAWDSVKGQDVAKQALREAVELPVLYSGLYAAYGKKASKGALLYGPPGCGKTMLGRMMAQAIGGGEEGFRYVKGGELFNEMVGAEEKQIRRIFSEAKQYKARTGKPQVVFFDEADALFPKRTGKADRGHSYDFMASTMGAFLSELDGMEDSGAFVILATNRQEVLDPALLRDGRIDRKIMVERPNREVCGDILRACLASVPGFEERFVDATLDEVYSPKRTYYIAETEDKGNVRITFGSSVSGAVITGIAQRIINEALQRDIKAGSTVATGICEKDIHAAVEAAWKETLGLDLTWLVEEVVGAVKISNLRTVHGRWLGIHGSESNKPKLEITVNHNLNDGSEDKF